MRIQKWLAAALASVALLATGCGSSSAPSQDSKQVATDVPASFTQNCAACHGAGMEGRSAPNLTKVGGRLSEEQIKNKIANGGGGMPGFKSRLGDEEVNKLSAYLASKK
jgi:cytochrome c551